MVKIIQGKPTVVEEYGAVKYSFHDCIIGAREVCTRINGIVHRVYGKRAVVDPSKKRGL